MRTYDIATRLGGLGDFDIDNMVKNGTAVMQTVGASIVTAIGTAAIIWAIFQTAKKVMGNGQGAMGTPKLLGLYVFAGVCLAFGIGLFIKVAKGSATTVNKMGGSIAIHPTLRHLAVIGGFGA